jgi:DNA modification methylase
MSADMKATSQVDLHQFVPDELKDLSDPQRDLPQIAKDRHLTNTIECILPEIPTTQVMYNSDARRIDFLAPESVHLVVTSPPYWTLKEYRELEGQLGWIEDYEQFLRELDKVWRRCFKALVPGGRLVCVVGDVCLSRRKNNGRHTVVPLHASIQEHCRRIGFDNLAPIIWNKISNAAYEVENGNAGFLGKPYEPNAVIKNDMDLTRLRRGLKDPILFVRMETWCRRFGFSSASFFPL